MPDCKILITLGFLIAGHFSYSQNYEQTLRFADSLFAANNYALSESLYRRLLFFSEETQIRELNRKLGICLSSQKKYSEAIQYFDRALNLTDSMPEKNVLLFHKAEVFIFSGNFILALATLFELHENSLSKEDLVKKDFFFAVSYFGTHDHTKSKNYFLKTIPENFSTDRRKVDSLFIVIQKAEKKSHGKLYLLSALIPGIGQLMAHNTGDALNSLALNSFIFIIGLKVSQIYSPFDAMITIGPWFLRYYKGNIKNAKHQINDRFTQRITRNYQKILDIVEKTQKTP